MKYFISFKEYFEYYDNNDLSNYYLFCFNETSLKRYLKRHKIEIAYEYNNIVYFLYNDKILGCTANYNIDNIKLIDNCDIFLIME